MWGGLSLRRRRLRSWLASGTPNRATVDDGAVFTVLTVKSAPSVLDPGNGERGTRNALIRIGWRRRGRRHPRRRGPHRRRRLRPPRRVVLRRWERIPGSRLLAGARRLATAPPP